MGVVGVTYFSDVLCIWAYASQARLDAVKRQFGDAVRIKHQFCSVFGDTARKMTSSWNDKGGYDGFNSHLREVAARFPHIEVHPEIWLKPRPSTSSSAHLFMKAVQQWDDKSQVARTPNVGGIFDQVLWDFRCAFFPRGVDIDAIEQCIHNGDAFARLAADYQDADKMRIEGSPSFVLNEGRQKLYGNIGFRLIEANIQELMREPRPDEASWC